MGIVIIVCNLVTVVAILISIFRMMRGPTVVDRILAFDATAISLIALVVLLSITWNTGVYLELILIISLLGFFGTIAMLIYLERTYTEEESEK